MDTNFHERTLSIDTYETSATRLRDRLAFVEHICGVMIEDRFDLDEPPRPWRIFNGDVQSLFSAVMCDELMPDAAFDFMPGEFVFLRFVPRSKLSPRDPKGEPPASAGGFRWNKKGEPPAPLLPEEGWLQTGVVGAAAGFFWDARSNSPPFGIFECLGRDSPADPLPWSSSAMPYRSAVRLA